MESDSAQLPNRSTEENLSIVTKGSTPMSAQPTPYESNQYRAELACSHCGSLNTHEAWCSTHNVLIQYAFLAVLNNELTIGDTLILHALGVKWDRSLRDIGKGRFQQSQAA